ncbi:MAG: tRNA threonylcarbamoyladenosine dehydratase [Candidatus Izemoplasma sp.]
MRFDRIIKQIGITKFEELQTKTVLVFGLGGVGSYAAEALVRSGIQNIIILDKDLIEESNINRQLIALTSTIGKPKVEVMKARLLDINPKCNIITYQLFYNFETKDEVFNNDIDYVIDAIDTITFKIDIIKECLARKIIFISSMGQAGKLHPELLEIADVRKTTYDPIAKVIRNKVSKEQIVGRIPVIYSKEQALKGSKEEGLASNALVPPSAGILAASYIINKIIE